MTNPPTIQHVHRDGNHFDWNSKLPLFESITADMCYRICDYLSLQLLRHILNYCKDTAAIIFTKVIVSK